MLLDAAKSSLLIVDVQERLLSAMTEPQRVVSQVNILLSAASALKVPVTISEQYPKGLGKTASGIVAPSHPPFEKMSFSCWKDAGLKQHFIDLHEADRPMVVVAGIEAHVCVLQTAIDLRLAGFAVFAVADAISSRKNSSVELACRRMSDCGVQLVSTEMVVFEWLERAGDANFKNLSALIR